MMETDTKCSCDSAKDSDCSCGTEPASNCGCETDKKDSKTGIEKLAVNEFSSVKNVIAVMSGKGGVGKSSVASLLACGFRRKGFEVGILDADITGPSVPRMFGIKGKSEGTQFGILPAESKTGIKVMSINLLLPKEEDPVIWRGPILSGVVKQFFTDVVWTDLEYLFVDLPPGTGDVPLTVMQSLPLNGLIVVTSPQELAVMIVNKAVKMAKQLNIPLLGLIENMSSVICPKCGEDFQLFGRSRGKEIAEQFSVPFLGKMPIDPNLATLCDTGNIEDYESNLFTDLPDKLLRHTVHPACSHNDLKRIWLE